TYNGNYANATSGNAYGGAIFNYVSTTIGSISGTYNGNYANGTNYGLGGAVANYGTINNLDGVYNGNYAKATSGYGLGGVIFTEVNSKINSLSGTFINNFVEGNYYSNGGAIWNKGTISVKATNQDVLFYNNTVIRKELGTTTYNDVLQEAYGSYQPVFNLDASNGQSIIFGGTIEGYINASSGATHIPVININSDNLVGGTYVFNNTVSGNYINIGSSTATNPVTIKLGSIQQSDGNTTTGRFDNIPKLVNYAENSLIDMRNGTVENSSVTTLTLNKSLMLAIDAALSESSGSMDKIEGAISGSGKLIVNTVNLTNEYSDSGKTATLALPTTGYEYKSDIKNNITGNNYFTKVELENGQLKFSDKLINQSALSSQLGEIKLKDLNDNIRKMWTDDSSITKIALGDDTDQTTVGEAFTKISNYLNNNYYTKNDVNSGLTAVSANNGDIPIITATPTSVGNNLTSMANVVKRIIENNTTRDNQVIAVARAVRDQNGNVIDTTYQTKLTEGTNITIAANGTISATDTTYSAGTGLSLSETTFALSDETQHNLLSGATAGQGLQITAGTDNANAQIALKLKSSGGLATDTDGLYVSELTSSHLASNAGITKTQLATAVQTSLD
ncbi:hypothetical protein IJ556_06955, partial [bacterium]|nr:hypothetical protein [bacterium]